MELNFGSWLKHKWNAFLDRNPYSYRADVGVIYTFSFFRRTCAAFLPAVSGLWGRVWKGKPCVPFLVCGGLEPITKRVPSFCYFLA